MLLLLLILPYYYYLTHALHDHAQEKKLTCMHCVCVRIYISRLWKKKRSKDFCFNWTVACNACIHTWLGYLDSTNTTNSCSAKWSNKAANKHKALASKSTSVQRFCHFAWYYEFHCSTNLILVGPSSPCVFHLAWFVKITIRL